MHDTSSRRYVEQQYRTDEALRVRIETHRRYGLGDPDGLFDAITAELRRVTPDPARILDVGAGSGNWYGAVRRILGSEVEYVAVDQSAAMCQTLRDLVGHDAYAWVRQADALALPFADSHFSWVGLHFMLYHVPDIQAALREAWRVTAPGGVMAAATNGARPYRELWDVGRRAAESLGLSGGAPAMSSRFDLETGPAYFPQAPVVVEWEGGFRFDRSEPVVAYLASGPILAHLGEAADDPAVVAAALAQVRDAVDQTIAETGEFRVHSSRGVLVWAKAV